IALLISSLALLGGVLGLLLGCGSIVDGISFTWIQIVWEIRSRVEVLVFRKQFDTFLKQKWSSVLLTAC
ncbi:unnamed protein product, partial [Brassica rapa subsp. narinosa]